jgi:hypothetical protein
VGAGLLPCAACGLRCWQLPAAASALLLPAQRCREWWMCQGSGQTVRILPSPTHIACIQTYCMQVAFCPLLHLLAFMGTADSQCNLPNLECTRKQPGRMHLSAALTPRLLLGPQSPFSAPTAPSPDPSLLLCPLPCLLCCPGCLLLPPRLPLPVSSKRGLVLCVLLRQQPPRQLLQGWESQWEGAVRDTEVGRGQRTRQGLSRPVESQDTCRGLGKSVAGAVRDTGVG